MPGSSVAEQVTVNHLVAGSIPARAAIYIKDIRDFRRPRKKRLSLFCPSFRPLRIGFRGENQSGAKSDVTGSTPTPGTSPIGRRFFGGRLGDNQAREDGRI